MRNFVIKFLLITVLCYAIQMVLPWWSLVIICFLVNLLIKTNGTGAFLSGFLPNFFTWFIMALVIHQNTAGVLTSRIATLIPLNGNAFLLIIITGLIAGLAGGMGGYTGNALRNVFIAPRKSSKRAGYHPAYRS